MDKLPYFTLELQKMMFKHGYPVTHALVELTGSSLRNNLKAETLCGLRMAYETFWSKYGIKSVASLEAKAVDCNSCKDDENWDIWKLRTTQL